MRSAFVYSNETKASSRRGIRAAIIRANETEALRGLGAVNASLLQVIQLQLQAFLHGEAPAFIRDGNVLDTTIS